MKRLFFTLSSLSLALCGTGAAARNLPNYEVTQALKPALRKAAGFKPVTEGTERVAHLDVARGLPTFVWANKGAPSPQRARLARMSAEEAARLQLQDYVSLYGAASVESSGARVASVSRNDQGVTVVTFAQKVGGHEIFNQSLKLLLNANNELVALSGALSPHASAAEPAPSKLRFRMSAAEAISTAYRDLTGGALEATLLERQRSEGEGGYAHYQLAAYARPLAEGMVIPARVKQVFYPMPGSLVPAYYVELNTAPADSTSSDYYSYVVSAVDGRLLLRNNLTAHAEFSYRGFADTTPPYTPHDGPTGSIATPHPTGNLDGYLPPFATPALITLQNVPFSRNDPWLPDGATVTNGNNVNAYADLVAPDGFTASGDLRPTVTAPGVFDRTLQFDIQPNANSEQIAAATTQLFFVNNWLHDWFYDAGFDEASRNAQVNNFGRGGLGNDAIRAEAQDYSGTDNANMSTPADGASPRMQMYVFTGKDAKLRGLAPASISGVYEVGIAAGFGPQTFDVTGSVVVADDGTAPGSDGCTALTNGAEVAGKIALIDRGSCDFTVKVTNAQNAGATGVIIADNVAGGVAGIGGTSTTITIPTLRITLADGNKLRAAIPSGLTVQLSRQPTLNLDGTVDNAIVAHEWGHYISNRLIGNAAGLTNNQGRAMGEGWGDFHALLMMVRAEDAAVAANANWSGVYSMSEYATRGFTNNSSFFGIRRGAYSVDRTKNALSFRHIMDGVALPTTTPFLINANVNSQFHNSGEIWATMLWECYVQLLRAHPFQVAQSRMKSYLVAGYKMTPSAPTYLEARDAIIAAAIANDPADAERFWTAFASRGAGVGAVAPVRTSTNHAGVVESFSVGTNVDFVSISLADDLPETSCDSDGILDNGETGQLRIKVRNTGGSTASATTVTVVSSSTGVSLGNAGVVNVPAIPVGGTMDALLPVTLTGATAGQRLDFSVALRDANQVTPGDKTTTYSVKGHYDETPGSTATETVDAKTLPWSANHDAALAPGAFSVVTFSADLNRAFLGPDLGAASDVRLITPALQVGTGAPFVVHFKHAYDFETDTTVTPNDYFDGAVIELSEDGGATWVDVGSGVYTGTLYHDAVNYPNNNNPLKGRQAITGLSAGFPAFVNASLDLGTAWAGKTVRLRFRIGSDNSAGATGWLLDDVSFTGITNTPFTGTVAETTTCVKNRAPVVSAGTYGSLPARSYLVLDGKATDADGDPLTVQWTQVSGPTVTFVSGTTRLSETILLPEVAADATVVLRLSVSDGTITSTATTSFVVRKANRPPTANAGMAGIVDERSPYTLSGSASDPDGDSLTYRWVQTAGTPVGISNSDKLTASFIAPEVAFDDTLTFTLMVSDGKDSAQASVNVTVRNVNRAPVANAGPDQSVDERETASLHGSATDPDGDAVNVMWTQVAGPAVGLIGANTLHPTFTTPEVTAEETLVFQLSATDGRASSTDTVTVKVKNVNRAPIVSAGAEGSVDERTAYTLTGTASDPDGDSLTYRWVQTAGTPVGISNANQLTASFIAPEVTIDEKLTFALMVNDGHTTAQATVDVVVGQKNRAPVAQAGMDQSVEERSTVTLQGSASDPDGDTLFYQWIQEAGPGVELVGADTLTPTFVAPEVFEDTVLVFRLRVIDSHTASTASVSVTVKNVNRAPTVNAGLAGAVNERELSLLSGSASDPDGDSLTYRWVQTAGPAVTLSGATSPIVFFVAPEVVSDETLTFELIASDGKLSTTASVDVLVRHVNREPYVYAYGSMVEEGRLAELSSFGGDLDGDTVTYAWTQVSGPPVTLSGADTDTATFIAPQVTADTLLTFQVTVSDGVLSASETVELMVMNVNQAPTVDAGAVGTVAARGTYTLTGTASDPDGDSLTYRWVQTAGTPVALRNADKASASFVAPDVGAEETLSFELTVTDGQRWVHSTVDVRVRPENREPLVQVTAVRALERSTAELVAEASDPDGDTLNYHWTQVSGPAVRLENADSARASFATGDVSADTEFVFQVEVSDGSATVTRSVSVTVQGVNRAPVAQAGAAQTRAAGEKVQLDGNASADADGDSVSFEWTQVGGPWVQLTGADSPTPSFTAPAVEADTELRFSLVVKDGSLASAPSIVSVTITPSANGCSATGAGAPVGLLAMGLLGLLRRRRLN